MLPWVRMTRLFVGFPRRLSNSKYFTTAQGKVNLEVDDKTGIATIQLNNAPVNSLDSETLISCTEAIKHVDKNKDIRGALLRSQFDGKVFCAGLNIEEFYQKSSSHILDFWNCVQDWYIAWYGCKKPTAAIINGHSPAGGCVFAMMCDYRVMQSGAGKIIGMNETRVGIAAPFYLIGLMKSVIGHRRAEMALLDGTLFSAEEAAEIGLVDRIDKLENLTAIATAELLNLISIPQKSFLNTKMVIRQDAIKQLIRVKQEDAEDFLAQVSQPQTEEMIGNYLKGLKSRKK